VERDVRLFYNDGNPSRNLSKAGREPKGVTMALEKEFAVYRRELPGLLKTRAGQWVLIHGDQVDSFWPTEDEAYNAGCARFGVQPFLVMPVEEQEPLKLHFNVSTLE
jgi:hypothetical protein